MGWMGKPLLTFILALPVGSFAPSWSVAGDQAPGAAPARHRARHQYTRSSLDDRASRFAKILNLSEAQQSAVKKILERRQQEMLRVRFNPTISGSMMIDRIRAVEDSTVEQIRAVLNEDQKKIYAPLSARRVPPAQQPNVEEWLKATAPH
jgi:hypothetical protein